MFEDELMLLFPLLPLPDDGVCLMCDDFVPELPLVVLVVELLVELVVLLFADDDVFELLAFRVVPDELPEVFELLRLEVVEDVRCCCCCLLFARRFLNQTYKEEFKSLI